jgi:ASC-1-like (ASCH) protein
MIADEIMTLTDPRELEMIAGAVKMARKQLAEQRLKTLKTGDRVRFTDNIRPKYLAGRTAAVKEITDKHVYVDGAEVGSRFANTRMCRVLKTTIELV